MPELPEVTTVIKVLKDAKVLNHVIKKVNILKPKVIKNSTTKEFINFLVGEKITDITRIGKYIIFHLTHNKYWMVHLRMEGKLFYELNSKEVSTRHLMVQLEFDNNHVLGYYDSRMFGTFHIFNNENDLNNCKELQRVSIDPLNTNFTAEYLYDKIHKINRAIKTTILDQSLVSGIGNIYADEILFASRIHPLTPAKLVTLDECKNIVKNAKFILKDAIKFNGTTVFSFKFAMNHSGGFQKYLKIYGHDKEPCPVCGTIINKIKVNGRGTHFCPKCQPLKE
ncbi:MAG: formamidopyrimidine-DNA glycosylase [Candidatus Malacoplasma girerdii]|nr:MAG: formamidopyrimidine-DNA glycosylase [Candidatus Malacoplasma girerdii]